MMVLKRSVQFTILILLVASFKFGWNYLQSGEIFPISVVKIEADYAHLSPEELQQTISGDLPASFWTVDIRSLKSRLQAIEWVQSVDIQKIWPETLKIRVNESWLSGEKMVY
jgi:cell division protein FtsQ